jgi:hypothetical protein
MSKVNDIDLIIKRKWSRSHQSNRNYLLIEEQLEIIYKQINKPKRGFNLNTDKQLASYDLPEKETQSQENNIFDDKHFIYDCLDPSNSATNDYKFYRIVFANGYEIICTSWENFILQLGALESKG